MQYRDLGRTGLRVSEIGFGAWEIGGPLRAHFESLGWISHGWGEVDDEESIRLIHACSDLGINFLDTAAGYGNGHSEEVVGRALEGRRRDDWVLETKGGEGFRPDGTNYKDFSKAHLLQQLEASLRRLRTDRVDVYLLHGPSAADIAAGECLEALAQMRRDGKARLVGVSLGPPAMGLELIERGGIDVFQVSLSLTDIAVTAALLPAAAAAGIGIVARCAFGAGFLTGAIDDATAFSDQDRRSWQSAESKAARAETARRLAFLVRPERTQAQACLQFPLAFPGVSTVIAGSKSLEHMRENAAASSSPPLTAADLAGIERALGRLPGASA